MGCCRLESVKLCLEFFLCRRRQQAFFAPDVKPVLPDGREHVMRDPSLKGFGLCLVAAEDQGIETGFIDGRDRLGAPKGGRRRVRQV